MRKDKRLRTDASGRKDCSDRTPTKCEHGVSFPGSKSRQRQQRLVVAPADIVDTGVDNPGARHLGQKRRVECATIKLPKHQREVGASGIPCGPEIAAELNLRRTVGTAYGDPPAAVAGPALPTLRKPRQ